MTEIIIEKYFLYIKHTISKIKIEGKVKCFSFIKWDAILLNLSLINPQKVLGHWWIINLNHFILDYIRSKRHVRIDFSYFTSVLFQTRRPLYRYTYCNNPDLYWNVMWTTSIHLLNVKLCLQLSMSLKEFKCGLYVTNFNSCHNIELKGKSLCNLYILIKLAVIIVLHRTYMWKLFSIEHLSVLFSE